MDRRSLIGLAGRVAATIGVSAPAAPKAAKATIAKVMAEGGPNVAGAKGGLGLDAPLPWTPKSEIHDIASTIRYELSDYDSLRGYLPAKFAALRSCSDVYKQALHRQQIAERAVISSLASLDRHHPERAIKLMAELGLKSLLK